MNADQRSEKTVDEFWPDERAKTVDKFWPGERDVQLGPAKGISFIMVGSALLYVAIAIVLLMHHCKSQHKSPPMVKKSAPVTSQFRPI